ncbi:FKBP-type peptidyl-prolyl cis-trans isomerase [Allorhodopirellula heiligendammensis]|uniref:Peptidyl-prolyl cis-trans isomerase n=1 Tax=Allorhodopirellula heiligendammensis TaxID=2714739 RepID=A0A5C6BSQ0_9BACT|nr:FKBP-type peptidyl-prolyl cis-trans isomerase [Allorhodopirellula heiligendammensis]TWU15280.1 FKBP-type 22 kDa peptidyl-prolyl cis-trans isomerase [Allorhodopirellula heiligendammensis]
MTTPLHGQDAASPVNDPVGYFLGFSVGQSLSQQGFQSTDFTNPGLQQGLGDALSGKDPALTDEQLAEAQGKIQAMLQKRQAAKNAEMREAAAKNLVSSKDWMAKNAKAEGVQELDKGIQYKVLTEGEGGSPTPSDVVRVHYTGKLTNGEVFDSSVQRGEPAEFPVNGVIQGWQLALQKMKVGSKWMLYIPPEMGYGERGSQPKIGPNEVLIFEVELLEIL